MATLTTGAKLGPYEITGAIGAGGMGEVYRARNGQKRGGGIHKGTLDEALVGPRFATIRSHREKGLDLVVLDDALKILGEIDPRKSRVVELRFFGGLSAEETAEVLKVAPNTVLRDWKMAKMWLKHEMSKGRQNDS